MSENLIPNNIDVHRQIEQTQNIPELLLITTGIKESPELLLAEFEESILDKIIKLLANEKEQHWCNQEEFSFLIDGLNSKLKDKYKTALTLAANMGIADFQIFDPLCSKFYQENEAQISSFKKSTNVYPLLEGQVQSRINRIREIINNGELNKKNDTNNRRKTKSLAQPIPEIDKLPFKKIINNLYRFSLAALQCKDNQKMVVALEVFEDLSLDKRDGTYDLFDVTKFSHLHHPEQKIRNQAQYILETFTALGIYIAQTIRSKEIESNKIQIVRLVPKGTIDQFQVKTIVNKSTARIAILEETFNCQIDPENRRNTLADDRFIDKNIKNICESFLNKKNGTDRSPVASYENPGNFTYDPLANNLIQFTLEQELLSLKEASDFSGFVLPSNFVDNPENRLITWKKDITHDDLNRLDQLSYKEIKKNLPHLLELFDQPLELSDLAAILTFLRPEIDLNESIPLEELKDQARGGMFPISKRGIRVNLDKFQSQDKLLAQTGLTSISFKRTSGPHNLEAIIRFGKRTFTLEIDEQMRTPSLNKLAPAEKAWIERVVFSYLLAIKNRDLYGASATSSESAGESLPPSATTAEEPQRKEASNSSHIYVLPYSHQPKDWMDPHSIINADVKEEIGYSLLELNLHFYQAQKDSKYLDTLEDKTLRHIILSSLKRLEGKVDPDNWQADRVQNINQQIREVLLGGKIAPNSVSANTNSENELDDIALIGFKHEPENPIGPPLQIKLNGVSKQLFDEPAHSIQK